MFFCYCVNNIWNNQTNIPREHVTFLWSPKEHQNLRSWHIAENRRIFVIKSFGYIFMSTDMVCLIIILWCYCCYHKIWLLRLNLNSWVFLYSMNIFTNLTETRRHSLMDRDTSLSLGYRWLKKSTTGKINIWKNLWLETIDKLNFYLTVNTY